MRTTMMLLTIACVLAPARVRADAIEGFPGECPPGTRIGISDHAEACVPIACTSDAQCGEGAACRDLGECWARRTFEYDGRVQLEQPVTRDVVVGRCDARGACAEGTCRTRRQCEPTVRTDAWDPESRTWTRRTHRASGCSVGGSSSGHPWLVALAALGLVLRRHRPLSRSPPATPR